MQQGEKMMKKKIRLLHSNDYPYFEAMDTSLEDDYVGRIFQRLTTGNHRLYGLFIDDQMVSMGGYSVFNRHYAMLGRLRSDRKYRGNDLATELTAHIMNEAFNVSEIQWVGANTQEENKAARRVIEKLGLTPLTTLYGAVTKETSSLELGAKRWNQVNSLERKKRWLKQVYIESKSIFPYECYYSFPASDPLFKEDEIEKWSFYENSDQTRVLITKYDQKKHHYLHAVYPWDDVMSQQGLWETISNDYRKLKRQTEGDTYIWIDLTKKAVQSLPLAHTFELPSPWVLYGVTKAQSVKLKV